MGEFERLSSKIKPILYDVHLQPDLEKFKFGGNVKIKIKVEEQVEYIIINAKELGILLLFVHSVVIYRG